MRSFNALEAVPRWPRQCRPVSAASLAAALTGPRLVGIHCWASWDGHDYFFARGISQLNDAIPGGVDLYSLDTDDPSNAPLLREWHVLNVPAFVVFDQGKWLKTFCHRLEQVDELLRRIRNWLQQVEREDPTK